LKECDLGVDMTQNTLHLPIGSLVPTGVYPPERKKTPACMCENAFERVTPPVVWFSLFFSSPADSTTLHKSFVYL